ncbi:MAG: NAD-dependent epimerase/dehydratase family protein [Rhodospirillales bacterium]|nr:NAD-dependent epimerase/dehydratase family protein [Rhodospirillales bacterium]
MKVIITGATGMVGHGVLLECLESDAVASVLVVGRRSVGLSHQKLKEVVLADFSKTHEIAAELAGYEACFYCVGVSSMGMSEADYRKNTHDLTLDFANVLAELSPQATFCYIAASGTDAASKTMWARIKGETENALFALPFASAYTFRPAYIHPMKGVKSRVGMYNAVLALTRHLYPLIRVILPKHSTTSENIGKALIAAARDGYERPILESDDINALANR